jgi:acyl-CoA synthetase (AMP-forming)/AMP-acid ligase II
MPDSFWQLVERAAEQMPEHVVLADEHGRTLTTVELRDVALAVAGGLSEIGVRSGEVVSWQLPTSLDTMTLMVALSRLGVAQNPIIPILRRTEVGFITRQVESNWIMHEKAGPIDFVDMISRSDTPKEVRIIEVGSRPPWGPSEARLPRGETTSVPQVGSGGNPVRWLYYSSGTTAAPKGCRHTDASVMAGANAMLVYENLVAGDIYPIAFPISHIGGAVTLTAALSVGARLVLMDSFDWSTGPDRTNRLCPTVLGTALPFHNAYIGAMRQNPEPMFTDVRICVSGGGPTPSDVHHAIRSLIGTNGIVCSYGLTEFPVASASSPEDLIEVTADSVGRLAPGVKARVWSGDGEVPAPGCTGQLQLKGPQCFAGYVDASLDSEAFTEDGWFNTGDLATLSSDGILRIVGRAKDIVIRNAENISAAEVEGALLSHPSIVDVAVIPLPDQRTGERVCAVVVVKDGHELTLADARSAVMAAGLAGQKGPEQIEIVQAIERNSMGKINKQQLVSQFSPRTS